jgi:hypothetical protein
MSEIVGESGPLQLAQAACTPTNPRSLRGVVGWKVIIVDSHVHAVARAN